MEFIVTSVLTWSQVKLDEQRENPDDAPALACRIGLQAQVNFEALAGNGRLDSRAKLPARSWLQEGRHADHRTHAHLCHRGSKWTDSRDTPRHMRYARLRRAEAGPTENKYFHSGLAMASNTHANKTRWHLILTRCV